MIAAVTLPLLFVLLIFAILWQVASGNLAAFLGALVSGVAASLVSGLYLAGLRWWRLDDPPTSEEMTVATRDLYWPLKVLQDLLPGVWIGLTATSPSLVAIGYWGSFYLLLKGIALVLDFNIKGGPQRPAETWGRDRVSLEGWLTGVTLLLAGTLGGILLRHRLGL